MIIPKSLFFGLLIVAAGVVSLPSITIAGEHVVTPQTVVVMKSVFGQVRSRDLVAARARIGGTLVRLDVEEGDLIKAGQVVANVVDDKLALQLEALEARRKALTAQFDNATETLRRTQSLFDRGTVAKARLDDANTQTTVLNNQIEALDAEISVNRQQSDEGDVLAPGAGRVLSVGVTKGSVVLPGETILRVAVGGYFLRLSLPERHAGLMVEGEMVDVGARDAKILKGRIAKVYPEIQNGRVIADVEVGNLGGFFIGERTLVSIPIDRRSALTVPPEALSLRHGIDYITLAGEDGSFEVSVIAGEVFATETGDMQEILSGLKAGDKVFTP